MRLRLAFRPPRRFGARRHLDARASRCEPGPPPPRPPAPPPPPGRPAAAPPPPLAPRRAGPLPAPVELPAVATRGSALLAIGGLDAADASVASIVRVDGAGARVVGRLPSPLHDAAAAAGGAATPFVRGGPGRGGGDPGPPGGAGGRAPAPRRPAP